MKRQYLIYLVATVSGLSYWGLSTNDPDLGWHLLGGSWITTHQQVPFEDFVNSFNYQWHDYHWLAQVVMFQIYELGGYKALRLGLGLLMALFSVLIVNIIQTCTGRRNSHFLTLVAYLLTLALLHQVVSIRPQIAALLILATILWRLLQAYQKTELPLILLLTILMANMHVYWIFSPVLWFLYRCMGRERRKSKLSTTYCWGGLAVLSLAALVSPYGILPWGPKEAFPLMNYALLWDYLSMPSLLRDAIVEMKGSFEQASYLPFLLIAYLMLWARTFSLRRALSQPGHLIGAAVSLLLATRSLKFVAVFAIFSLPTLASALGYFLADLKLNLPSLRAKQAALSKLALGTSGVFALALCLQGFPLWHNSSIHTHLAFPVPACKQLAKMAVKMDPKRDHLRVLTPFTHGGWCRWAIYQENPALDYRVTSDGRTQWVPPEHYRKSFDLYRAREGWLQTLHQWNPDIVLVKKREPLYEFISRLPNAWAIRYEDPNFALYEPRELSATTAD